MEKRRRLLPTRGTRHPYGSEAANGCPGLPRTAANNVKSFLARQKVNCRRAAREAALGRVRAKKLFSRSECRAVGEAQSGVKTLQKAGLGLTFA